MNNKSYAILMGCLAITMCTTSVQSQTKAILFDGYVVAGYADHGAFINCTGPGVKFNKKPYSLVLGLLPSLRIKADHVAPGATKNAAVTPNLGFGLTVAFQHLALQLPFYYNTKTATRNGKWNPGIGIGYKF